MLTVDPTKRPSCEELLTSNKIVEQLNQLSAFDNNVVNAIKEFYDMS